MRAQYNMRMTPRNNIVHLAHNMHHGIKYTTCTSTAQQHTRDTAHHTHQPGAAQVLRTADGSRPAAHVVHRAEPRARRAFLRRQAVQPALDAAAPALLAAGAPALRAPADVGTHTCALNILHPCTQRTTHIVTHTTRVRPRNPSIICSTDTCDSMHTARHGTAMARGTSSW